MYLSNSEGFNNEKQVHYSDTFQRTILNDCLIDISDKFDLNNYEFFNKETEYLISKINDDEVGGWSYFPTVKEIAADIDDLGQIIQFLIKTNNHDEINKFCLRPIEISLLDRVHLNGGIETWIIPKENQTELQKKQENFNLNKWGKGPDIEVVANFIYSLYIFNPILYKKNIENSLKYISEEQNIEGFWESRWYYGYFYGTYICLRLLKQFELKYPKQIHNAIKYITRNQNKDGGFSATKNKLSDPISTAYALLSMQLFYPKSNLIIKKSKKYLIDSQNINGYWDESDFIKPKASEPYKSKTLTTAIVLKSLCYGL